MLFMVIERFNPGCAPLIRERFRQRGRMLPEGIIYHASWVDSSGVRCFQVMEAGDLQMLQTWASQWNDLVDFEFVPVLASAEFWERGAQ